MKGLYKLALELYRLLQHCDLRIGTLRRPGLARFITNSASQVYSGLPLSALTIGQNQVEVFQSHGSLLIPFRGRPTSIAQLPNCGSRARESESLRRV